MTRREQSISGRRTRTVRGEAMGKIGIKKKRRRDYVTHQTDKKADREKTTAFIKRYILTLCDETSVCDCSAARVLKRGTCSIFKAIFLRGKKVCSGATGNLFESDVCATNVRFSIISFL
ncbi:hypothetical protein CDAR_559211 [Caerostris darwini]|uniref:Uncharacterized protein n=1 Tax=Caerostris darwini TaxID=1538125 RepID=A0AAV4NZ52_9ARAC|nr:hypothetical protein CDAR_559211 [Caerostris darwini]